MSDHYEEQEETTEIHQEIHHDMVDEPLNEKNGAKEKTNGEKRSKIRRSRSRSRRRSSSRSSSRTTSSRNRSSRHKKKHRRHHSKSQSKSHSRHSKRRRSRSVSGSRSRSRSRSRNALSRGSAGFGRNAIRSDMRFERFLCYTCSVNVQKWCKENPPPSRCIGVFGLSLYTDEKTLSRHFSEYGRIDRVQIVYDKKSDRSRGFAFLYFDREADAVNAKENSNGVEIDGHRIRVDFSMTRKAHTPTPGVYMGRPSYGFRSGSPAYSPPYSRRRRSRSYSPRR